MIDWSTDQLSPRDRFECWREERGRRLFGVEAELAPERRPSFLGRIRARPVGPATVIDLTVSVYTMRRTARAIDRNPDRAFYVWKTLHGGGLLSVGERMERVRPGALSSGLSDVPYAGLPDPEFSPTDPPLNTLMVRIPLEAVPEAVFSPNRLPPLTHQCAAGIDALFGSYLAAFFEQAPHLAGAAAEQAVRTLAHLALATRGEAETRDEAGAAAIREGLLVRACRMIEQELHRTDLSPARVAARLGISVRKLHLVFEPSGESFSRRVLACRLVRADLLLREAPTLPVTEVAYASGFDSLSTFFRCYRAAFGASPGERRAAMSSRGDIAAPAGSKATHREDGPDHTA